MRGEDEEELEGEKITGGQGEDIELGVYGLAGMDFAAEDVGCVVYDGEDVRGAAESLCGVEAGPCAVQVPDWLCGHSAGLVCGMLVVDGWWTLNNGRFILCAIWYR